MVGYPQIRDKTKGKTVSISRYLWEKAKGIIPFGLCVLHKCDNRACINMDHFFLGTQLENIIDMKNKKRNFVPTGEKNPNSKLTKGQIINIRKYKRGYGTGKYLSKIYNVQGSVISAIRNNKTWKHLA
jgi:hypothetical protein